MEVVRPGSQYRQDPHLWGAPLAHQVLDGPGKIAFCVLNGAASTCRDYRLPEKQVFRQSR
jgi:hypothetical protein